MTSEAERDARVADAAEAWLVDPMKKSLYGELVSAVRSRRVASTVAAPVPAATTPQGTVALLRGRACRR
jgi:hypothetical protein